VIEAADEGGCYRFTFAKSILVLEEREL